MSSKLAGTTMSKISFEGVLALKRAGLVLAFQTVCPARLHSPEDEQSILFETSRPKRLFSEPPLLQKRFYS